MLKTDRKATVLALALWAWMVPGAGSAVDGGDDVAIGMYLKLHSDVLGEERTLLVHLPEGYEDSDRAYPVLYQLDGDNAPRYSISVGTVEDLASDGRIPEMIVVAVANTDRARDMFPVKVGAGGAGGGSDDFLRFLTDELIPFVDRTYRTVPYRALYGASNAGLFTVYALLARPTAFNAFIAASPTLGWCFEFMQQKAQSSFAAEAFPRRSLYVNYGESDYDDLITAAMPGFVQVLESRAPKDLRWHVELVEGEGHVPYTSLYDGLRAVFPTWPYPEDKVESEGVEALRAHYDGLSKEYGFRVQVPLGPLLELGGEAFGEKKWNKAVEVFELAVRTHPSSPEAHYLLGAAYQRSDDRSGAIQSYRKALELKPDYARAKEMLRRLEED